MSNLIASIRRSAFVLILIVSLPMGCSDSDDKKKNKSVVEPSTPVTDPTNYPYYNDLEPVDNAENPYVKQEEWRYRLGDNWSMVQDNSRSPDWHLEFSKTGSGLGSTTAGTALLETAISIPDTAAYPTLSFWHQLHLEKKNQSVILEVKVVNPTPEPVGESDLDSESEEAGWIVLRRFYEADNSEDYTQVSVDLTPYIGKSLQFRLRTVERSEKAEEASGITTNVDSGHTDITDKPEKKEPEKNNNSDTHVKNNNGQTKEASAKIEEKEGQPYLLWRVDDFSISERDTDQDGIADIFEIRVGTDPYDPESIPADTDHDGIPDVLNALTGTWDGPCRYVGGGEYLRESLIVTEFRIKRAYQSSAFADCHVVWNSILMDYDYALKDMVYEPENLDAKLNLELKQVAITPSTADVAEALNRTCDKQDFVAGEENEVGGVSCSGGAVYPQTGVVHYDIIRQREKTVWLGEQQDVTDPTLRSTRFDSTTAFKKAGSTK